MNTRHPDPEVRSSTAFSKDDGMYAVMKPRLYEETVRVSVHEGPGDLLKWSKRLQMDSLWSWKDGAALKLAGLEQLFQSHWEALVLHPLARPVQEIPSLHFPLQLSCQWSVLQPTVWWHVQVITGLELESTYPSGSLIKHQVVGNY